MKKLLFCFFFVILIASLLPVEICADKVYEYELSDGGVSKTQGEVSDFFESLPDEIKEELPESREDISEYDIAFFEEKVKDAIGKAAGPALETVALLLFAIIFSSLFSMLADTVAGASLKSAFSFCSSLCMALCMWGVMEKVLGTACALLDTMTSTMLLFVPAMEAVYISSGNLTASAVSATGLNLMIGLGEALFSKVLAPCVNGMFILAVISVVTGDRGVAYMTKTIRGIVTGGAIAVMTLMTFVLSLQSAGGAAQDGFLRKTVKFAIGNYLPFVGAAVADSFSVLSSSLDIIKHACGIGGIAAIAIAFFAPFAVILMSRIAIGFSGAMAEVLGCSTESKLLEECKGICTLLLATCAGGAVMYVIALGLFCKTPISFG